MTFLVVGAGSIGRRHIKNLRTLGADRLLICDTNPAVVDAVVQQLNVKGFSNLRDALAAGPDAILICAPTHLHVELALAGLEAGAHLFIEKPVSASLARMPELLALARSRQRVALVACNMRFHPGVALLKRALLEGRLVHPLYFHARFSHYLPQWRPGQSSRESYSARRSHGGGIMLESVHEFDYLRWLAGDVTRVAARPSRLSDLTVDSEDYAVVLFEFESGAAGLLHVDYLSPWKLRGCEIVGTGAVLRWQSEGKSPETVSVQHYDRETRHIEQLYASDAYDPNDMYLEEMRHFLACIAGQDTPALDVSQAARILELALIARDGAVSAVGREASLPFSAPAPP